MSNPNNKGKKCRFFHRWETKKQTLHTYQECKKCEERRVIRGSGGYQPINKRWIENGRW